MSVVHTYIYVYRNPGGNATWKGVQPSAPGILLARPGRQGLAELGHGPEILSGNQGGSRA